MKSLSLTFSLFFVIFFSNPGVAQTLRSEPVPFTQDAVGEASCGPTSLFYAMRLGRDPRWTALYENLSGVGESQKANTLVSEYGFAANAVGSPRYDANGVWLHDLGGMLEDVASHAGVKADHFVEALERKEEEFRPHRMLNRIHSRFKELAEKGSPAVLLLRSMLKYHDAAAGTFSWDRVGGHFVVFKDVQRELRDDEQGFSIQILDPQSGKVQTIYVYEETMLGFAAEGEPEAGCTSGAELKRFVSSEMGYDVLSPYLKVLMPRIDLTPQSYRQNEVNVVTLSGMAGLF